MSRKKGKRSANRSGKAPGPKPKAGDRSRQRAQSRPWSSRIGLGLLGAASIAFLGLIGYQGWLALSKSRQFHSLVEEGQGALARVHSEPSQGRDHVPSPRYESRFPLSGPHQPRWTSTGIYENPQPLGKLVHALEHGNIVIYYDEPGPEVMDRLRTWAGLFNDKWSGIVLTPKAGLGEAVVLTAWTKRLRLAPFEPAAAAAFIDTYRGRGPENPVR